MRFLCFFNQYQVISLKFCDNYHAELVIVYIAIFEKIVDNGLCQEKIDVNMDFS